MSQGKGRKQRLEFVTDFEEDILDPVTGSVEEIDWDYLRIFSTIPLETGNFSYEAV